jgi:hypothetical protein
MSQMELNEAIARATGESVRLIDERGFSVADPLDVEFDPEPRAPFMIDWDSKLITCWPG